MINLQNIEEVFDGLIALEELKKDLQVNDAIILNGLRNSVAIGRNLLVKINTSVGLNSTPSKKNIHTELKKNRAIIIIELWSRHHDGFVY